MSVGPCVRGGTLAALLLCTVVACSAGDVPAAAPSVSPSTVAESSPPAAESSTPAPATTTPEAGTQLDESHRLFDDSFVHAIAIEVEPADLVRLTPGSDERVRARLTIDGTAVDQVGIRLKGGAATLRPLTEKAGFSIDTDEFVRGRSVFGVTRFTLGNAVYDPSFIAESITYDVFRRAGGFAPRTAFANVSLNGELYGLYVMREGYDKGFLRRTFANPDGNLYEATVRVDISDSARMEARTNEAKNDKSDLEAVAAVVAGTPDDRYVAVLGMHVDLDQLLTYWAVEALTDHWDGYAVPSEWSPNNYYVYRDPARQRFVFLAHGADWTLSSGADATALAPPSPAARMATRLYANAEFRRRLQTRTLEVLDRHWDTPALLAEADRLAALVRATRLEGSKEGTTLAIFEEAFADRRAFIANRAVAVHAQLAR